MHDMRNARDRLLKAWVILEEGRWCFGPDNEIGMRGIGRADDFTVRRAGLRNSSDVGFALFGGEVLKLSDVSVPLAGAGPVVVAPDVEVGLDEDGGGRSGGLCGRQHIVAIGQEKNRQAHRKPPTLNAEARDTILHLLGRQTESSR